MPITVEQMVQREVLCCMSSMVSTVAQGYGCTMPHDKSHDIRALTEQAFELSCPVQDYEEAATQAGWENYTDDFGAKCWRDRSDGTTWAGTAETLCFDHDIEPYEWEVFEHWAVSTWLAEKLIAQGERVDTDFANLNVWARTCTGQGIACDGVMQRIHAAMLEGK